jgi:hypothetical protein
MEIEMRKWLVCALLTGVAPFIAACDFEAPPPALTPPPVPPPPPVSSMNVTLAVPAADIARLLNEQTNKPIASLRDQNVKCAVGSCKLTMDAKRTGPIAVAAQNGALRIGVPFAVNAQLSLPGMLSAVKANANLGGRIDASAALSFANDWQVRPETEGTVKFQNGRIHLGPMNTDLADVWNANAELLSRPLFRAFDAKIAAGVHPRGAIAKFWTGISVPIKVSQTPTAWLVLQPERIRIGAPATANNAVILNLGVDVRARMAVQDEVPAAKPTPLPAPAQLKGETNRFAVAVPVVLSYETAAKLALDQLKKKPLRAGSHGLRIDKLQIIPSGKDVVVAASFCVTQNWDPTDALSGCGSGYLRGTPAYDAKARAIRIVGVHYDILTEDLMLKVMHSLAGPELGHELEKGLKFDIGKDIDRIEHDVAAALAKPQGDAVSVSGKVDRFGTPALTWTKEGFLATVSAEGSLHAEAHL